MASEKWAVDQIDCGYDDGSSVWASWNDANEHRFAYMDANGHERRALVRHATDADPRPSTFTRVTPECQ